MNALSLRLYLREDHMHGGQPLHQWLLARARALGLPGGSTFRAIAGYGRHGQLHAQHFFELAGQEPVLVECIGVEPQVRALLAEIERERLPLAYACTPVEYGVCGDGDGAGR